MITHAELDIDTFKNVEVPLEVGHYPAGEPMIKGFNRKDRLTVRTGSVAELFEALLYADARAWRGEPIKHLVLPYVPGARQDRLNRSGDVLFTLRSVAEAINARNFESVTVLDPHSDVTPALIHQCRVITAAEILSFTYRKDRPEWDFVIAPDAGAAKRAYEVAQAFGLPFVQGEKHRDVTTGELSGFSLPLDTIDEIAKAASKLYPRGLVVDDICDGGGTFLGLAGALVETTVVVDLFVTHGLFTKGTEQLLDAFGSIYTTDSLPDFAKPGVTVIDTFSFRESRA